MRQCFYSLILELLIFVTYIYIAVTLSLRPWTPATVAAAEDRQDLKMENTYACIVHLCVKPQWMMGIEGAGVFASGLE